jgi:hypothetical protein
MTTIDISAVQNQPGLSVEIGVPLVMGGGFSFAIDHTALEGYSHAIDADWGFWEASVNTTDDADSLDKWASLIGYDVKVFGPSGQVVWEGLINKISIRYGPYSYEIGPYLEIINHAYVQYSTMRWDTDFPVGGDSIRSDTVTNDDSIARYGILQSSLSGSDTTEEQAEAALRLYVAENAYPKSAQSLSLGEAGSKISVSLSCAGYAQLFTRYFYENIIDVLVDPILIPTTDKIARIIAADPNGLFTTANTDLRTNETLVHNHEEGDRYAEAIIKEITSIGDGALTRWVFYVDTGLKCVYRPVSNEVAYRHSLYESATILRNLDGSPAMPWDVRPGTWIESDINAPSASQYVDSGAHRRFMFVESVRFTYPFRLELSEKKVRRLDQALARLGLGSGVM